MSMAVAHGHGDLHELHGLEQGHAGPAPKRIVTGFGFIPARFSLHFAPSGLADAITGRIASGVPESSVRYLLGDGSWPWWTPPW